MKGYSKPAVREIVNNINEAVCMSGSYGWGRSGCYNGGVQVNQDPELGNNDIRFDAYFEHDCTGLLYPHSTDQQWLILQLSTPLSSDIAGFIVDSEYDGDLDFDADVGGGGTLIRFKMSYYSNPYHENIGIGDLLFHIVPATGVSEDAVNAAALSFKNSIQNSWLFCPNYRG